VLFMSLLAASLRVPLMRSYGYLTLTVGGRSKIWGFRMPVESSGQSAGNPRMYELIADTPKDGDSPTVWAWLHLIDHLTVTGQPVQAPWPPHQQRRADLEPDGMPRAVPDPEGS